MIVEWFRSATVALKSDNGKTSILCDPWISDGAFIGSWFHWPPLHDQLEFTELLNRKWSAIYISHLHADHFDRKWIAKYTRKHPEVKFLIPKHSHEWLKSALLALGVKVTSLIELDHNRIFHLEEFTIRVIPADVCNPRICRVSVPCHSGASWQKSIDSLAIFEADGQVVVNANDVMATESVPHAMRFIEKCDLLMASYGGAGPYPQCFPFEEDRMEKAQELAKKFVHVVAAAADLLQAKAVFPYAGQYLLGGNLVNLNEFRSIMTLSDTQKYLETLGVKNVVTIEPFGHFSVTNQEVSKTYQEPSFDLRKNYLNKIHKSKFPYQMQESKWPTFSKDVEKAFSKIQIKYAGLIQSGQTQNYVNGFSFKLEGSQFSIGINFQEKFVELNPRELYENLTTIYVDDRLLRNLIRRTDRYSGFTPMHWNQAEIGSHFEWKRVGNYEPNLHYLFNFFQS